MAPDGGVSQAPGASKGAKSSKKRAERAVEVGVLAGRLAVHVFEDE